VYTIAYFWNSLYALTLGKKRIVFFFSAITLTQVIVAFYMVVIVANKPGT